MNTLRMTRLPLILAATWMLHGVAGAKEQAIVETLNGTSTVLDWTPFHGALPHGRQRQHHRQDPRVFGPGLLQRQDAGGRQPRA